MRYRSLDILITRVLKKDQSLRPRGLPLRTDGYPVTVSPVQSQSGIRISLDREFFQVFYGPFLVVCYCCAFLLSCKNIQRHDSGHHVYVVMVYPRLVELNRLKIFIINHFLLTKIFSGKNRMRVLEIPSVAWDRILLVCDQFQIPFTICPVAGQKSVMFLFNKSILLIIFS